MAENIGFLQEEFLCKTHFNVSACLICKILINYLLHLYLKYFKLCLSYKRNIYRIL